MAFLLDDTRCFPIIIKYFTTTENHACVTNNPVLFIQQKTLTWWNLSKFGQYDAILVAMHIGNAGNTMMNQQGVQLLTTLKMK